MYKGKALSPIVFYIGLHSNINDIIPKVTNEIAVQFKEDNSRVVLNHTPLDLMVSDNKEHINKTIRVSGVRKKILNHGFLLDQYKA